MEIDLTDSITLEKIKEPVLTSNGSLYDKDSISEWLRDNNNDAMIPSCILKNKFLISINYEDIENIGKKDLRRLVTEFWQEYYKDIKFSKLVANKKRSHVINGLEYYEYKYFESETIYCKDVIFSNCIFKNCNFRGNSVTFEKCNFYSCENWSVKELFLIDSSVGKIKDNFLLYVFFSYFVENCLIETNGAIINKNNYFDNKSSFYLKKLVWSINNNKKEYFYHLCNEIEFNNINLMNLEVPFLNDLITENPNLFESLILNKNIKQYYSEKKLDSSTLLLASLNTEFMKRENSSVVVYSLCINAIDNNKEQDVAYLFFSLYSRQKFKLLGAIFNNIEKTHSLIKNIQNVFDKYLEPFSIEKIEKYFTQPTVST